MLDKMLRQSNDFWIQFTEVGRVLDHTDPVGSGRRHQAGPGGAANGLLAVSGPSALPSAANLSRFGDLAIGNHNNRAPASSRRWL